jgi:hypothetical protein
MHDRLVGLREQYLLWLGSTMQEPLDYITVVCSPLEKLLGNYNIMALQGAASDMCRFCCAMYRLHVPGADRKLLTCSHAKFKHIQHKLACKHAQA